jgi:hypothetical protein
MNEQDKNSNEAKQLEHFLATAFCIDGTCEIHKEVLIVTEGKEMKSVMFKLTDSKRGTFYITMSK